MLKEIQNYKMTRSPGSNINDGRIHMESAFVHITILNVNYRKM